MKLPIIIPIVITYEIHTMCIFERLFFEIKSVSNGMSTHTMS